MFGPAVQLMLILQLHSEADSAQAPTDTALIPSSTCTPLPTETFKNGSARPTVFGEGGDGEGGHNLKRRMMPLLQTEDVCMCSVTERVIHSWA